ncbi:MAG: hypothetical protein RLZZ210_728 [Pseudomonadota bacterium]|jgi:hypothetical protein
MVKIIQGDDSAVSTGNRVVIHCEGNNQSIDLAFYSTLLGNLNSKFDLQAKGSCNLLFELAVYINNKNSDIKEFCLIDKDYRSNDEINTKQKNNKSIKFLSVHEVENCLFYPKYLLQLDYIKPKLTENKIEGIIQKILIENKVQFLADFLQSRINSHLDKFPRIDKLNKSELPQDDKEVLHLLENKLNDNYQKVKKRISEMKNKRYTDWINEFETISNDKYSLCGKIIFDELLQAKRLFIKPPSKTDIAKHISEKMRADNFMPANLGEIFKV